MSPLPYGVRTEEEDGYPVYVLEDRAARSQAWVVPGLGFNAYRFSVERGEESLAILDPPATLGVLAAEPAHYGLPILFPFAGSIAHGRFTFGDRAYQLPVSGPEGHAAHGFVLNRPWQVIASGTSIHDGAVLVGRIESRDFPELAGLYPSAFRLDVTYRLREWSLAVEARAENVGPGAAPVCYGLHPYLRAPIGQGPSVGGCVIEVPATRRWELDGPIPTGRLLPLEEDLPAGVSLEGRTFDDVYTGLLLTRGASRAILSDTRSRLAVVVEADRQFANWVVYTPPRPAVSLEPWTCVPNAVNLQGCGPATGLTVLEPGEHRSWTVRLTVRELAAGDGHCRARNRR